MLTRHELARLERWLRAQKVLSVYLDGASTDPATRTRWRHELDELVARERAALHATAHGHEEREAFERCVGRLYAQLDAYEGALGTPGWVGLFPAAGDAHVEALPVRMPTLAAWGDGARVAPYVRALKQYRPAIVTIVSSRSATIRVYAQGALEMVETLRAEPYGEAPQHMGYPPPAGFHTGTRGATATDEGERQRHTSVERMLRDLVRQLAVLAGARAWILVGGTPEMVSAVIDVLPASLQSRAHRLEDVDVHATEARLRDAAEHMSSTASRERELALVVELLDARAAGGRGVAGAAETLQALQARAVDCLYFTGTFIAQQPTNAEALVRLAFDEGAELEHVSGEAGERLDQAGGVGALLRFAPAWTPPLPGGPAHAATGG